MPSTASEPLPTEAGPPSSLIGLIDQIIGQDRVDVELAGRLHELRDYIAGPRAADGPFLTVLLRTQGQRIETLKDALLCLQGQSSQDFEVLVLAHDAKPENAAAVRRIVERQPPAFRQRIRVELVRGGHRGRPLNVGIAAARGRYIAVLDDDDLVLAHWIETFQRAAALGSGRLIRAVVANQSVAPEVWPNGSLGFRALSSPDREYPASFDQLAHLSVNYSPFMSWAFPRELFILYGLRFDEELTVCEDWDIILRGTLLCGVDDAPQVTAVYRRWEGAPSSYSVHTSAEWAAAEKLVIDRIDRSVILMPPGTASEVRRLLGDAAILDANQKYFAGDRVRWPLRAAWRLIGPATSAARGAARRLGRRN